MTSRYSTTLQILALTAALGASPAIAQDTPQEPITIELLLELAANNAVDDALNLPGAELGAVLAGASDAQLSQLVASLSPAQADAMVASVAQSGTGAENVAKVVTAVITANPGSAARIVDVVRANTAPAALAQVADAMVSRVEGSLSQVPPEVSSALTTTTVSLDVRSADRLVEVANRQEGAGDTIIRQLAVISQGADPETAAAIERAVAPSPRAAQVFSDARGEAAPAAVTPGQPPAPAPVPVAETPPAPTPPAEIGGAGATPGGTNANDAGSPTQVASNSPSTGGGTTGSSGGSATPPSTPTPVSPTN